MQDSITDDELSDEEFTERLKTAPLFGVTATGHQWVQLEDSIRQEQATKETRRQEIPAQPWGGFRQEIEACLNGRELDEEIRVTAFDAEVPLLRRHVEKLGMELSWVEED